MSRRYDITPVLSCSTRLTIGYRVKSWFASTFLLLGVPQIIFAIISSLLFKHIEPVARARYLTPGVLTYFSAFLFFTSFTYGALLRLLIMLL